MHPLDSRRNDCWLVRMRPVGRGGDRGISRCWRYFAIFAVSMPLSLALGCWAGGGGHTATLLVEDSTPAAFSSYSHDVDFEATHELIYTNLTADSVHLRQTRLILDVTQNGGGGEGLKCTGVRIESANDSGGLQISGRAMIFQDEYGFENLTASAPVLVVKVYPDLTFYKGLNGVKVVHKTADELAYGGLGSPTCEYWWHSSATGFIYFMDGWWSQTFAGLTDWYHTQIDNIGE